MKLKVSVMVANQEHNGKWRTIEKVFLIEVDKDRAAMLRTNVKPAHALSLGQKVDVKVEANND